MHREWIQQKNEEAWLKNTANYSSNDEEDQDPYPDMEMVVEDVEEETKQDA